MLQQLRSKSLVIWAIVFVFFVVGFLLADTSGLLGMGGPQITNSTAVAEVNGTDVSWMTWQNLSNQLAQTEERNTGRGLTLDERQRIEDQAFEQLVGSVLLEQEYRKRGIRVSDEEIREAAQQSPPPEMMQNPELQTDGRFDVAKYRRLLSSAAARQQGLLLSLESYYRSEIPKAKLFDQLAGDVFVSDAKLWANYRDQHDSVKVSFVQFDAAAVTDSAVTIGDAELRAYYDKNKSALERPGRAVLSVLVVPRAVNAADSAAALARVQAIRQEIASGTSKFEDVARRESADTTSGTQGGDMGRRVAADFVEPFASTAKGLKVGELSQPVLTQFGYHLIRKDAQFGGDTLSVRHILLRIGQSDSSAVRTDRRADSLSRIAANAEQPSRLDSAAKVLGLEVQHVTAFENDIAMSALGRPIPSVSAWAFTGAKVGEISDLYDSEDLYAIARLDTLVLGGVPSFNDAKADIRRILIGRKKAESLLPRATAFANGVAAAGGLEAAARAADMTVTTSEVFTRPQFVPGLGRFNEAIGASFALPVGAVSTPVVTDQGVVVLRVDSKVSADSAAWVGQKDTQRRDAIAAIQQLRVRTFLSEIRKSAKVEDHRRELNAAARAQTTP
ncbi:MAG: SurA N-terminal domain-containing protein [Gemmatimonadaceae bacterium]|nr:SurA N-terminal domain-containing protein [Gemmatimonadaceae bacterium]